MLISNQKESKISSEIDKLRTWLVKHQDETIPDGSKAKIVMILEKYNRLAAHATKLRSSVVNLFSDYLQLPEGKLVSSKDKARVLTWLNNIDSSSEIIQSQASENLTKWTVEVLNMKMQTISLLNENDVELWKEDFRLVDSGQFESICALYNDNKIVVVSMSDNVIVDICSR